MSDKKIKVAGTAPSSVRASIIVRSTEKGRLTSMGGKGTQEQLREAIRRTLDKAR